MPTNMRTVVIESSNLKDLSKELLRRGGSAGSSTLKTIQAINSHVDFAKLRPGTVLLVPDAPDVKVSSGKPLGTNFFEAAADELNAGLKQRAEGTHAALVQHEAEREAVLAATKSAAFSRLIEGDRTLREQLKAADTRSKADMKRLAESESSLVELRKLAVDEVKRLEKAFAGRN